MGRALTFTTLLAATILSPAAYGQVARDEDSAKSLMAQAERAKVVLERGRKPHYSQQFDLSKLPKYKPKELITGWITIHGSNYLADGLLGDYWEKGFQKFHPEVKFSWYLPTASSAFAALYYKQADLVMGHKPGFYDLLAYQRMLNHDPTEITAVTGSYDVAGWENSTVILVNEDNPLNGISLDEIDGIFGAAREGGWAGTNFRPDWARGAGRNIRSWGQMGLSGAWADKRISPMGFAPRYNTATDFSDRYLKGGDKWNEDYRGFAHIVQPDGTRYIQADQITDTLAADAYGIAFNRYRGDRKRVRVLPVSWTKAGPFIEHTIENVQNRTYPLYNEAYFYTSVAPGAKPPAIVREFIRYVLSQEGQAEVQRDGKYLPLTAEVVEAQLAKMADW